LNCVLVGSIALSIAQVGAVRQRTLSESASAVHVLESIGNLLQQRSLGGEEMLNRIAQGVTPGATASYASSLDAVVKHIEGLEQSLKSAQATTQTKLDALFKGLGDANAAVNEAKTAADASDKSYFECAAAEQAKRQAAEAAEKSMSSSRSNEKEACQLQQDNKGFAFDTAAGKYKMSLECDFSVGNCDAQLQTLQETMLKKMEQDATAALAKNQANYNSLKATCDMKKKDRVAAQSSLSDAGTAWSNKRASCKKLSTQRQSSFCAFGSSAQSKCAAEKEYTQFVAATQQGKGGIHSEADRVAEWSASQTTKCMVSKAIAKGLDAAIASADVDACASQVNFESGVGKLNTRQGELRKKLAGSNRCAAGVISFFNGQMWNVPAGDKPQSSAYTRTAFTPELNPAAGNFDFC